MPGRAVAAVAAAAAELTQAGAQGLDDGFDRVRRQDRFLDALEVLGVQNSRVANVSSVAKLVLGGSPATVWSGRVRR